MDALVIGSILGSSLASGVIAVYATKRFSRGKLIDPQHVAPIGWHNVPQEHHVTARCTDCKGHVARYKVSADGSYIRCLNCIQELGAIIG